jgi:HEAT repeat protein
METNNTQIATGDLQSDNPAIRKGTLSLIFMAAPDTAAEPRNIAACLDDPEDNVRILAVETLAKWGAMAVPFITTALAPEQPEPVRIAAASCLGRLGSEAEPAVVSLSSCLESDNDLLLWHAGFALSKIGPAAFPELKNKLASANRKTVLATVQSLGWMEKNAVEAVEAIEALAEKKDPQLTIACASALVRITGAPEKGLAMLLPILEEGDTALKIICIREMGLLGDKALEGRNALMPSISDPDPEIRSETVLALARIGHPDADLVDALMPLLSDEDKDVRANTGIALSVYGSAASPALPALETIAEGEDPRLCAIARKAIQAIQV